MNRRRTDGGLRRQREHVRVVFLLLTLATVIAVLAEVVAGALHWRHTAVADGALVLSAFLAFVAAIVDAAMTAAYEAAQDQAEWPRAPGPWR